MSTTSGGPSGPGSRSGRSASPGRRRAHPAATSPVTHIAVPVASETETPSLALPPSIPPSIPSLYKKVAIPRALREQVWIERMGRAFEGKCPTTWCKNNITVFDFHCGHNVPESKGGETALSNLVPICSRCNLSMGDTYTFDNWCRNFQGSPEPPTTSCYGFVRFFGCLNRNG